MSLASPTPPPLPALSDLQRVTLRQLQCLAWVEMGKSAGDIGVILGISSRTVEGHILKICLRLGVRTRLQAVIRARQLGLLPIRRP